MSITQQSTTNNEQQQHTNDNNNLFLSQHNNFYFTYIHTQKFYSIQISLKFILQLFLKGRTKF